MTSGTRSFDDILVGLAKGAAIAMFVYYFFKALVFVHDKQWALLGDFWGAWYLLEVLGSDARALRPLRLRRAPSAARRHPGRRGADAGRAFSSTA